MTVMTSSARSSAVPTDLDSIVALENAVLRNLLITQRYHDLSRGLRETVDDDNANWSTFATWASKTAGETIRDQEVPKIAVKLLADADEVGDAVDFVTGLLSKLVPVVKLDPPHLLEPIHQTIADLSAQIALGNLKVFRELAPVFASFIETFRDDRAFDETKLEGWIGKLRNGPPQNDGQELLKSAFRNYYQAKFETDDVLKAQLLLAANCQIGLHEQTRLQPQIEGALDAPIEDLLRARIEGHARQSVPEAKHGALQTMLDAGLSPILKEVAKAWREIATRHLMSLALPFGERLSLGSDLRAEPGEPVFPAPLQRLSAPPDLLVLVSQYDRASTHGAREAGSAAIDWASLPDRMNFIINLFRSRQQDEVLFDQPFDEGQRDSISEGMVPVGV